MWISMEGTGSIDTSLVEGFHPLIPCQSTQCQSQVPCRTTGQRSGGSPSLLKRGECRRLWPWPKGNTTSSQILHGTMEPTTTSGHRNHKSIDPMVSNSFNLPHVPHPDPQAISLGPKYVVAPCTRSARPARPRRSHLGDERTCIAPGEEMRRVSIFSRRNIVFQGDHCQGLCRGFRIMISSPV